MKFVWSVLLAVGGATLGVVLVCIAPFVAVASLAARTLPLRDALGAVAAMWALDELVGYAFLHYPHATASYGWGFVMLAAAMLATLVARRIASPVLGFIAAFVASELALFAYGLAIGETGGFTPAIVAQVLLGNLVGFAVLGAIRIAMSAGSRRLEGVRR